jgi:hypothetical protein
MAQPEATEAKATAEAAPAATELAKVAIEVRNGNGAPEIANLARDLLKGNGLKVRLIGNHIDFGVAETVVTYRSKFKQAAAEINRRFFSATRLEESKELRSDVDVKVLLGHDVLKGNPIFSHLKTTYPVHEKVAASSGTPAVLAQATQGGATGETAGMINSATMGTNSEGAESPGKTSAGAKMLEPARPKAAVEVRNGTWAKDLASITRDLLKGHGYQVPVMGNHIDFGAQETVIYYRPEQKEAALELNNRYFKAKRMEVSSRLRPGVGIKVLLGKDLFQNSEVFAALGP